MDEALLRRLLGAAALLALAFLVATLLPAPRNGARDDGTVIYDLRTGEQRNGSALPPVGRPPAPVAADAPAETSIQTPPSTAPSKADRTPDPAAGWFVQVGSFASQPNARGALQKLRGMGMPTVIQAVAVEKTTWYRVRVGSYGAFSQARVMADKCRQDLGLGQAFVSTE